MTLLPQMPIPFGLVLASLLSVFSHTVFAGEMTLYTDTTPTTTSSLAPDETYTGLAAYDPTRLTPPSPPSPAVTSLSLSIPSDGTGVASQGLSLSKPHKGNFLGFSIELSVATSLLGSSSGNLKVPFLNFMANIQNRAGAGPIIRVGGNSQEGSTIFVDGLEGGVAMEKIKVSSGVVSFITQMSEGRKNRVTDLELRPIRLSSTILLNCFISCPTLHRL